MQLCQLVRFCQALTWENIMSNGSSLSLLELEKRIAIIRDNIRQLVEQAAAFSGAEDEARNADRIAQQTEELERLAKQRDALLKNPVMAAAAKLGLEAATFAGHSPRAGFVTSAVKRGANLIKITDVTGHRSLEMLKTYSRDAEAFVGHAGTGLL